MTQRRRDDRWYRRWRPLAAYLLLAAAVVFSFYRLEVEGEERRNQTCALFERQEAVNVTRVFRTYEYLERLPREEYGSTLTVAIVRNLSDTETEARSTIAPAFCDEKGVGLPEPERGDPRLPEPRDFSYLLRKPR